MLKLSGESLSGDETLGIDPVALTAAAGEIVQVLRLGVQLGIVIGGGNFVRARDMQGDPIIQRITADYMGMLGTVMNALALRDALEARGRAARVLSAIPMAAICETFTRPAALEHLEAGRAVIFAAGTGCPFFTTDTTAALRAGEIGAELILKATKVDGVFDSDPVMNPSATRYDRLTYQKALEQRLGVMDMAAFSLCRESRIPIIVCDFFRSGNLARAVRGEEVGTRITE